MRNSILILLSVISAGALILFAISRSDFEKVGEEQPKEEVINYEEYDKCKDMRGIGELILGKTTIKDLNKKNYLLTRNEYPDITEVSNYEYSILDDTYLFDLYFFRDTLYTIECVTSNEDKIMKAFDTKYTPGLKYDNIKLNKRNNLVGKSLWKLENKDIEAYKESSYSESYRPKSKDKYHSSGWNSRLTLRLKDLSNIHAYADSCKAYNEEIIRKNDSTKLTLY